MKKNRWYNFRFIHITPILLLLFGCNYFDGELVHIGISFPIDEKNGIDIMHLNH